MTLYTTRAEFKARVNIPDLVDDTFVDTALESICREIDQHCRRSFFVTREARTFQAITPDRVLVDDLLSVEQLATDPDGDRVYETTWDPTDFDLLPDNARSRSLPEPFWEIATAPRGRFTFPAHRRGVSVTGLWGYYDVRRTLAATIAGNYLAADTTLEVSDAAEFQIGQTLWIGDEQLEVVTVTAADNDEVPPVVASITVRRGVNGTTPTAISTGAAIQLAVFPVVGEAALLLAQRHFHRRQSPFGVEGTDQLGSAVRIPVHDPDVRRMLTPMVLVIAR